MKYKDVVRRLHSVGKQYETFTLAKNDTVYQAMTSMTSILISKTVTSGDVTTTLYALFRNQVDNLDEIWSSREGYDYKRYDEIDNNTSYLQSLDNLRLLYSPVTGGEVYLSEKGPDPVPDGASVKFPMTDNLHSVYQSLINQNLIKYSNTLNESSYWTLGDATGSLVPIGGGWRVTQVVYNITYISALAEPATGGKEITSIFKARPSVDGSRTQVRLLSLSTGYLDHKLIDWLPNDRFSYMVLRTNRVVGNCIGSFGRFPDSCPILDTKDFHYFESMTPAFYNFGDSIALSAKLTDNSWSSSNCYAQLFAINERVEFEQEAIGGSGLLAVKNAVNTVLGAIGSTPAVMIEGGVNDVITTLPNMKAYIDEAVTTAKTKTNRILISKILHVPAYGVEVQHFKDYNIYLQNTYGGDPLVTLYDPNTIIDPLYDYAEDRKHLNPTGQKRIADYITTIFPLIGAIERWNYEETADTVIDTSTDVPMTTAILATMGTASGSLPANQSMITCNDTIDSILQVTTTQAPNSADGTTDAVVAKTFAQDEQILLVVQVLEAGANYKVGWSTDFATITWGTTVLYDGSFSPLEYLRVTYDIDITISVQQVQVWSTEVDDAEILNLVNNY